MGDFLRSAALGAAVILACAPAAAQWAGAVGGRPTRPTASPSPVADAPAIARDHVARRRASLGLADDDLDEVVTRDHYVTRRTGASHVVLRQRLGGIDVFGADATATIDSTGRLASLGDRLVRDLRGRAEVRDARISAAEAVVGAAEILGLALRAPLRVRRRPGGAAREVVFEPAGVSRDEIPVRLEYVPMGPEVRLAWNLVVRTPDGHHWWNLHLDAESGELLRRDDWIDHETYRVFPSPLSSPDEGPRVLSSGIADPVASPYGWHDTDGATGAEFTDTRGNNVFAQEDEDGDDAGGQRPDGGPGLTFDLPIDLGLQPSAYQDAATVNLFYWVNLVHDVMYHHGFDEPAGNFQLNDYGNGGAAGDPVQADVQDGSGIDNARFATPPDGQSGRMDMFRWEQSPGSWLDVQTPPSVSGMYAVGKALFGAGTPGLQGDLVLALDPADASGPTTTDACSPLTNPGAVAGRIALVDRGECFFVDKVAHVQDAGAIGVAVVNNQGDQLIDMLGNDPSLVIPAVFLTESAGAAIAAQLGNGVEATIITPADRDASLDSGVIVHEYGHGVSNRLTGGPANVSCLDAAQSAGMGEGWSDWWALAFLAESGDAPEDARSIAPYLVGQQASSAGIRNHPYSTDPGISPLTYGDLPGLDVPHGVGEVWAAALWESYWNLVAVYGFDPDLKTGVGGNNLALQIVMDALKMQPCDPTFLDGRQAILDADLVANAGAHRCLFWDGFAKRGVGVSASDGGGAGSLSVAEAFDVPAECEPLCGDGLLQVGEECDDGNTVAGDGCSEICIVPEPGQTAMLVSGIVLLLWLGRRSHR